METKITNIEVTGGGIYDYSGSVLVKWIPFLKRVGRDCSLEIDYQLTVVPDIDLFSDDASAETYEGHLGISPAGIVVIANPKRIQTPVKAWFDLDNDQMGVIFG